MILNAIVDYLKSHQQLVKLLFTILLMVLFFISIFILKKKEEKKQLTRKQQIVKITTISIFSALSIALYFLKFNLPFLFPGFLEIQFSNVPVLISGFLLGPVSGVMVVIIRTIIKLPFTSTIGVGELADLLIGLAVVLISSYIYHHKKTKKNAILALIYASIAWVVVAFLANLLFLTDFYIQLFFSGRISGVMIGGEYKAGFLDLLTPLMPWITEQNYMVPYLLLAILPFNILLSSIVSILSFIVYKRTSILFHKYCDINQENNEISE